MMLARHHLRRAARCLGDLRPVERGDNLALVEGARLAHVETDASDPSAIGNATAALAGLTTMLDRDLPPLLRSTPAKLPFQFIVHARYNPEQLTVLNIVPGLA